MKNKVRNGIIGGIVGVVMFSIIASSYVYKFYKDVNNTFSMDFDNWGEEFLHD